MSGTDTGFLADYDLTEEYRQLNLAGLNYRYGLAMLTTSPAQRFRVLEHQGRVGPGMNGDLTIFRPILGQAIPVLLRVAIYMVRDGRVSYSSH